MERAEPLTVKVVVSAGLYIYKGLDFTAALYAFYTIIAIFGYFKWKKMMLPIE